MDQSLPLMTNPLLFIGQQAGLLDLLHLKPQHVFESCTIDTFMLQGIQLRAEILPSLVGLLVPSTQLMEASERIEGIELFGRGQ